MQYKPAFVLMVLLTLLSVWATRHTVFRAKVINAMRVQGSETKLGFIEGIEKS